MLCARTHARVERLREGLPISLSRLGVIRKDQIREGEKEEGCGGQLAEMTRDYRARFGKKLVGQMK